MFIKITSSTIEGNSKESEWKLQPSLCILNEFYLSLVIRMLGSLEVFVDMHRLWESRGRIITREISHVDGRKPIFHSTKMLPLTAFSTRNILFVALVSDKMLQMAPKSDLGESLGEESVGVSSQTSWRNLFIFLNLGVCFIITSI